MTGPIGIAALLSVALRRPLLLLLAEQTAKANPDLKARLANPARRRFVTVLTAIAGSFWLPMASARSCSPSPFPRVVHGRLHSSAHRSHRSRRNRHRPVHPRPEQADQQTAAAIVPLPNATADNRPPAATRPLVIGAGQSAVDPGRSDRSERDALCSWRGARLTVRRPRHLSSSGGRIRLWRPDARFPGEGISVRRPPGQPGGRG